MDANVNPLGERRGGGRRKRTNERPRASRETKAKERVSEKSIAETDGRSSRMYSETTSRATARGGEVMGGGGGPGFVQYGAVL